MVLEKIGELGMVGLDAFFPRNYAYARLSRELLGLDRSPRTSRRTFSAMMSRLKRQGLIEGVRKDGKSAWSLTPAGAARIAKHHAVPAIKTRVHTKDGVTRLVIFDVPERERKKRAALRVELFGCGFTQLQKSVWIGRQPLPQDFVSLIDELELADNVHIFSIREHGTIPDSDAP